MFLFCPSHRISDSIYTSHGSHFKLKKYQIYHLRSIMFNFNFGAENKIILCKSHSLMPRMCKDHVWGIGNLQEIKCLSVIAKNREHFDLNLELYHRFAFICLSYLYDFTQN